MNNIYTEPSVTCECGRVFVPTIMQSAKPSVPRVAESLDDLREGQWIAWADTVGQWGTRYLSDWNHHLWSDGDFSRGIVILYDPPPAPVSVSHQAFDRLAQALKAYSDPTVTDERVGRVILSAARAVVDEVRGTTNG